MGYPAAASLALPPFIPYAPFAAMSHRLLRRRAASVIVFAALVLAPGLVMAAAAPLASAPAPSYLRELMGIVVPLGFMILALLLVLRLMRRRYGLTGSKARLSVLQILPVGPRERVVLLQTRAGRVLAIGVSAQSVNLITRLEQDDVTIDPDSEESGSAPAARTAKSPLDRLLRR